VGGLTILLPVTGWQ